MSQPAPMTGEQLASLVAYTTAVAYFMTTGGVSARRLLDAKAHMEACFGVKMPYPGEAPVPQTYASVGISPLADLL